MQAIIYFFNSSILMSHNLPNNKGIDNIVFQSLIDKVVNKMI